MATVLRASFAPLVLALPFSSTAQAQETGQPAVMGQSIVISQKRSGPLQSVTVAIEGAEGAMQGKNVWAGAMVMVAKEGGSQASQWSGGSQGPGL